MTHLDLIKLPEASGNNGIHILAQLEIEQMHLDDNGLGWAATTMRQASAYIKRLESLLTTPAKEPDETRPVPVL